MNIFRKWFGNDKANAVAPEAPMWARYTTYNELEAEFGVPAHFEGCVVTYLRQYVDVLGLPADHELVVHKSEYLSEIRAMHEVFIDALREAHSLELWQNMQEKDETWLLFIDLFRRSRKTFKSAVRTLRYDKSIGAISEGIPEITAEQDAKIVREVQVESFLSHTKNRINSVSIL